MANVLIGSYTARLDASGRIKIPEKFREVIEQVYGKDLFVTSLSDDSIKIYPLSVWLSMTDLTSEGAVHLRPDVRKFMLRVNRNGSRHELDSKGRVLISQALREKAKLHDEVEKRGGNWDAIMKCCEKELKKAKEAARQAKQQEDPGEWGYERVASDPLLKVYVDPMLFE